METPVSLPEEAAPITLGALFRCFLFIGVTGFGSVLPSLVHELVVRRRWLTHEEFAEVLSICQIVPGANIVNVAVAVGMHKAGWKGSLVSVLGLLVLPVMIGLTLATLYVEFTDIPQVQGAIRAIGAAASGLVAAVALSLARRQLGNPVGLIVSAGVFVTLLWLRPPLLLLFAVAVPLSIFLTALWMRWGE